MNKKAGLSILFAGDFCPINRPEQLAMMGSGTEVFRDMLFDLHGKDLSVINLECPLTKKETPIRKSGPNLKADPSAVSILKAARFDVAFMANNHIADYGTGPVIETMELLKKNRIRYVGAGKDLKEAKKPLTVTRKGRKITFMAFAENEFTCADSLIGGANPLDPIENIRDIQIAREKTDILIVLIHGGNEFNPFPSPRMVKTYRAFADAGASAVIGTHPHVPQGFEICGSTPIFYSLGNIVFDYEYGRSPMWYRSFLVKLVFKGNRIEDIILQPYRLVKEAGCPGYMEEKEFNGFVKYLSHISKVIGNRKELEAYWEAWCAMQGPDWMKFLSKPAYPSGKKGDMSGFLAARNALLCEAHHELLSTYMDLLRKKRIGKAKKYIPKLKKLMKGIVPKKKGKGKG